MTARLGLLRHASAEQAPGRSDLERELLPGGWEQAHAAGRWFAEHPRFGGRPVELVLCSTAVRARQTWEGMQGVGSDGPSGLRAADVWFDRRIYQADAVTLLQVLRDVPEELESVLLVGHAPGVPALAALLADPRRSHPQALTDIDEGYPTTTCAVLSPGVPWPELSPGEAVLEEVVTHRV